MKLPFQIDLKDKVAVITGAGGVLCSGFAKALAACGAKVALLDINTAAAQLVADEIVKDGEWINSVNLIENETHNIGLIADQNGNDDSYFSIDFSYGFYDFDLYEMDILTYQEHSSGKYKIDAVNNPLDKASSKAIIKSDV